LARFGIFPIMHLVVLCREYYEKHRFAATSLFNVLNESQEIAYKRTRFSKLCNSYCHGLRMNLMRSKKSLAEIRGHMELAEQKGLRSAGGVPI
jgi:hypothetical protein